MCTWSECISFISQFKRQTLQFWMPHYWKVFASRSWKKDRDRTHREYQTNRSTMTGCWKTQKKLYVRQCKATEKEVASVNLTTFQHTKKRERCESITIFNLFFFCFIFLLGSFTADLIRLRIEVEASHTTELASGLKFTIAMKINKFCSKIKWTVFAWNGEGDRHTEDGIKLKGEQEKKTEKRKRNKFNFVSNKRPYNK